MNQQFDQSFGLFILLIRSFQLMMDVHICTFQIKLQVARLLSSKFTEGQSLEAVWRSQKGQIIIVGAVRPSVKQAVARFDETFQIKTDLLRDPTSGIYQSSILLLELRKTGQPLNEKVSSSICGFDLANILVKRSIPQKTYTAQDKSFQTALSISCSEVEETGIQKKIRKQRQKGEGSQTSLQKQQSRQDLHNTSRSRSRKGSRQSSREKKPAGEAELLQQIKQLKEELNKNQVEHIITQQNLYNAQNQFGQQQNVINELAAIISQRETTIIELNHQLELNAVEIATLSDENGRLGQKIIDLENQRYKIHETGKVNYEKTIEELKASLKKHNESETELKKSVGKQKEISLFLTKNIDQLKRDLGKAEDQKKLLAKTLKTAQQDRDMLRNKYNKETGELQNAEKKVRQEMQGIQSKYNTLYQQYSKMKKEVAQLGNMVHKRQMEEQISIYQSKINLYEKKESEMKEHAEEMERALNNFQELLEEKEGNEQILIEHSRKLQLQIDSINYEKGWWQKLLLKEENEEKTSYKNGKTAESEQIQLLKDRVKQLMKILEKNAQFLLESQKNKREIGILQKQLEDNSRRQAQQKQELRELKERIKVLLSQNKKIFSRTNEVSKENQTLSKINRRQFIELDTLRQRDNMTEKDVQILHYRIQALEKQIIRLNDALNKKNDEPQEDQAYNIPLQLPQNSDEQPMEVIKQAPNEDFNSSNVMSHKQSQSDARGLRQFQINFAEQYADLLRKRQVMLDELKVQIAEVIHSKTGEPFEGMSRQLKKLVESVAKIKITLIRAGQKDSIRNIQLIVKNIQQQINSAKVFGK